MRNFEDSGYWTGRRIGISVLIILLAILALFLGNNILETVEKGTYHIKQAAITGEMTVHSDPGMYFQNFGDKEVWPNAETFYFTADSSEGESRDQSIEVRFNDGSISWISGSLRVRLPGTDEKRKELVTKKNFKTYDELEHELILKVARGALRLTANLMSARESYAEKRPDYVFWAWDQIQNGLYQTEEETREVIDPISGKPTHKTFKIIKTDPETGEFLRQKNPLEGLDLDLSNFEIKLFKYEDKVLAQISKQQEALMAVATARAEAEQAEQDSLTMEAKGKALVMQAKYEEEEKKARAIVQAEQAKEMAVIKAEQERDVEALAKEKAEIEANKKLEVAKLAKAAAAETKEEQILLGEGESERKRLVMAADGALEKKLMTYQSVMQYWADAIASYTGNWVPMVNMSGSSEGGGMNGAQDLLNMLSAKTAKDLALDFSVKGSAKDDAKKNE